MSGGMFDILKRRAVRDMLLAALSKYREVYLPRYTLRFQSVSDVGKELGTSGIASVYTIDALHHTKYTYRKLASINPAICSRLNSLQRASPSAFPSAGTSTGSTQYQEQTTKYLQLEHSPAALTVCKAVRRRTDAGAVPQEQRICCSSMTAS